MVARLWSQEVDLLSCAEWGHLNTTSQGLDCTSLQVFGVGQPLSRRRSSRQTASQSPSFLWVESNMFVSTLGVQFIYRSFGIRDSPSSTTQLHVGG